jgi:hypothetical protein
VLPAETQRGQTFQPGLAGDIGGGAEARERWGGGRTGQGDASEAQRNGSATDADATPRWSPTGWQRFLQRSEEVNLWRRSYRCSGRFKGGELGRVGGTACRPSRGHRGRGEKHSDFLEMRR